MTFNTSKAGKLLWVAPLVVGLLTAAEAHAATLGGTSQVGSGTNQTGNTGADIAGADTFGRLLLSNFNQLPIVTDANSDTETAAIAPDPSAEANSDAKADSIFTVNPAVGEAQIGNFATGQGRGFSALGKSVANSSGAFFVRSGESFSFDFDSFLGLNASSSGAAQAKAAGNIDFALYDVTDSKKPIRLDFFQVLAQVDTPSDQDFLTINASDNFKFSPTSQTTKQFWGFNESLSAALSGSFNRKFDRDTSLLLASAPPVDPSAVPEPSTILATLACGGVVAKLRKRSRQS
jgi:hypothetical protein